jgi:anti-anti-sigma factor
MAEAQFQHLKLSMDGNVALVEIMTRDIQGPELARELGNELALVLAQDWARKILLDFRRVAYLSSTGFAAIFKLVSQAKAEGREVRICGMEHGVRLGAEIIGLPKVVEIHDDEASALNGFARG